MANNVETPFKAPTDKVDYLSVDFCPRKTLDFEIIDDDDDDDEESGDAGDEGSEEEEQLDVLSTAKTSKDVLPTSETAKHDLPTESLSLQSEHLSSKKLPPPPVPPRVSSLCPPALPTTAHPVPALPSLMTTAAPSPLSLKIAASR